MDCCCEHDRGAATDADSATRNLKSAAGWRQRVGVGIQWAVPVCILALVPKCPVCVAGYVLLFTGIGISTSAASTLRWGLIATCGVILGLLALRFWLKRRTHPSQAG